MLNPLRRAVASIIPPCSECEHYTVAEGVSIFDDDVDACACQAYLRHSEKVDCKRYATADCDLVRGGLWCRFKRNEQIDE